MQRPERILYLGVGIALSPVVAALDGTSGHPLHPLAVVALALVALISVGTAVRRSVAIYRQLHQHPLEKTAPQTAKPTDAPDDDAGQPSPSLYL